MKRSNRLMTHIEEKHLEILSNINHYMKMPSKGFRNILFTTLRDNNEKMIEKIQNF